MTFFRDNNKLLFPLLGLALLSSGGLSTSALSFKLSLPLSLSRGGGNSSPLFHSTSFKSPGKVLNLESQNASNYKFSLPEEKSLNQSLIIETPQESLKLTENFDINQTKQLIPKLFSQSDQKEKVLALQKKVQAEWETQFKKLKNKEDNYKSASKAINDYTSKRRWRREALTSPNSLTLNKNQKEAIRSYFESYSALEESKEKFLKELSDSEGTSSTPAQTPKKEQAVPSWTEIDEASKKMNWDSSSLRLFGGPEGEGRKDDLNDIWNWDFSKLESKDRNYGWGGWDSNPYKNFYFNQTKWKESVQKITEPQKKLYEMTTGAKWVTCGIFTFPFGYWGKQWCGAATREQLRRQIEEAKSEFDYEIWSKYLEWMNQKK